MVICFASTVASFFFCNEIGWTTFDSPLFFLSSSFINFFLFCFLFGYLRKFVPSTILGLTRLLLFVIFSVTFSVLFFWYVFERSFCSSLYFCNIYLFCLSLFFFTNRRPKATLQKLLLFWEVVKLLTFVFIFVARQIVSEFGGSLFGSRMLWVFVPVVLVLFVCHVVNKKLGSVNE